MNKVIKISIINIIYGFVLKIITKKILKNKNLMKKRLLERKKEKKKIKPEKKQKKN